MFQQSLSTPLILDTKASRHAKIGSNHGPSQCTLCVCSSILGLLIGVLSQTNSLSIQVMELLSIHVTNGLWLSFIYALITTAQLIVVLLLLRSVTALNETQLFDLDFWFGFFSLLGVSAAWVGVVARGSELWRIVLMTSVSLSLFSTLMYAFGGVAYWREDENDDGLEEKRTTAARNSEGALLIV